VKHPAPVVAVLAVLAGCAVVAGCAIDDGRTDPKALTRRPLAYQPEDFPDLPLERMRGYRLAADQDEPLAVSYAGGGLRRFQVVYISSGDTPETPQQVLDRLAGGLTERGWVRQPPEPKTPEGQERYAKGDETLTLSAEASHGRTVVAWNLARISTPH
jgi:hypothetical protein